MHIPNIVQGKIGKIEKKSIKKTDSDSVFEVENSEAKPTTNVTTSAKPQISTAWMLQEVDAYAEDQRKMKDKGRKLLNHLCDVRMALLSGLVSLKNLESLQRDLDNSNIELSYPELREVLNDIRVRAAVELAKFEIDRG